MNVKMIFRTIGRLLQVEAALLLLPTICALIYKEFDKIPGFLIPIGILLVLGFLLTIKKPENTRIYAKEGFAIVGLSWIVMSFFGALPFVITKMIPNFFEAYFETVSGFTTTGSSIITNIDEWYISSKSLLFWRSFTHWVGGMGVLVFVLAILPNSEGQNIYLIKAESTGAQIGKLVSKVKSTARILYVIYFVLTLIQIIMLVCSPSMNLFEAMVHAFGSAGTGGFGIRSTSLADYSIYCQVVIAIFMVLNGINFNMFYLLLIGKFKDVLKNEELRWYLIIILVSTIIIAVDIYFDARLLYDNIGYAIKDSYFQVASIITTTGYATADFAQWSMLSKTILFILMFIGGCAGSTAGGIKVQRVLILTKSGKREIKRLIHPKSVSNVKFEGQVLSEEVVHGVTNYFGIIMTLFALCILLISFNGFDFETNVTAVAACINNIGPGLSQMIGPTGSFAEYNDFSTVVLTFAMLVGRLEIYPILLIFTPRVWLNK